MCGIGCLLSFERSSPCLPHSTTSCSVCNHYTAATDTFEKKLSKALERRGGDTPTRQYSFTTDFAGQPCQDATPDLEQSSMSTKPVVVVMKLLSSVLHLRGENLVSQPLLASVSDDINSGTVLRHLALCWNGECYAISATGECIVNEDHFLLQNDTEVLLRKVQCAIICTNLTEVNKGSWSEELCHCISQIFGTIKGEYAFILSVILADDNNFIFFGRDPLGRRSLLINRCKNSHKDDIMARMPFSLMRTCQLDLSKEIIAISSVAPDSADVAATADVGQEESSTLSWIEVPPGRIFCIDVTSGTLDNVAVPKPAIDLAATHQIEHGIVPTIERHIFSVAADEIGNVSQMMLETACRMHHLLNIAVRRRVLHVPRKRIYQTPPSDDFCNVSGASVGVLFSGGLDSVVLAALCHNHVPQSDPIDLINVAFHDSSSTEEDTKSLPVGSGGLLPRSVSVPDRTAALASFREMSARFPTRQFNFIAVDVNYCEVMAEQQHILSLIKPSSTHMDFNIGSAMWFASRALGYRVSPLPEEKRQMDIVCQPGMSRSQLSQKADNSAALHGAIHPPSDVFSPNPSVNCSTSLPRKKSCVKVGCPRSALSSCVFQSCTFCCSCYQKRISRFLGGSASGVCQAHMSRDRRKLKNGKKEEADKEDSLICKNQFNTRCQDKNTCNDCFASSCVTSNELTLPSNINMTSGAKVLIVGIGADEQMAGYRRHRSVYQRGGYNDLRSELNMEMERLWCRNLGRDDRCISDHGKEARFPFLDEDVVNFLSTAELSSICDMDRKQGVGDKMILRLIAKMIGVKECSNLVKRAIQFGSRIAKVSEASCFASRRQASGTAQFING